MTDLTELINISFCPCRLCIYSVIVNLVYSCPLVSYKLSTQSPLMRIFDHITIAGKCISFEKIYKIITVYNHSFQVFLC